MQRISKEFYLGSIFGGVVLDLILFFIASVILESSPQLAVVLFIIGFILLIYVIVVVCKLLYKAWDSIQDEHARTTPGKAVGFSFIPIFNFYWVFQLFWGFAKDYNSFKDRRQLKVPQLSENLFLVYSIFCIIDIILWRIPGFGIAWSILGFLFTLFVLNKMCDAVNSIEETTQDLSLGLAEQKSFTNLFSKNKYSVNYTIGVSYLLALLLTGFVHHLIPAIKGHEIYYLPVSYYLLMIVRGIILSLFFVIFIHLVSKDWLLVLVLGCMGLLVGILFTLGLNSLNLSGINKISPLDIERLIFIFIRNTLFYAGLVFAVYLWGIRMWSFILGIAITSFIWEVFWFGIYYPIVSEYAVSFENILTDVLFDIFDSLASGMLIYLGVKIYFQRRPDLILTNEDSLNSGKV